MTMTTTTMPTMPTMPKRRHRARPTRLPIGVISEGTLRTDDLVDALIDALSSLRLSRADRATVREAQRALQAYHDAGDDAADDDPDGPVEALDLVLDDLTTMADAYAPDYAYYGSTDGDGACIGIWPSIPDGFDDDVYRAGGPPSTTRAASRAVTVQHGRFRHEYAGQPYWLDVNDHGNCTLYRRAGNRWIEVWSVV